jgi:hypothetical protein
MALHQTTTRRTEERTLVTTRSIAHLSHTVLFLFAAASVIIGCVEEPSPVGSRLLPDSDFMTIDTTTARSTKSTTARHIAGPSGIRWIVGTANDVEAWGLVRFHALPETLKNVAVLRSELRMRTKYHFGDSLAAWSVNIHPILRQWGTDSITIDSVKAPGFYDATPRSSFSISSLGDTADVQLPLDTALVRSWLSTAGDTSKPNFGVLLRPTNTSVAKGFEKGSSTTAEYQPHLMVRYMRQNAADPDSVLIFGSVEAFVVQLESTQWESDSTRILIQNGASTRSFVHFDLSTLPAQATIHRAYLELTLDPSRTGKNFYTVDSLNAFFVSDDESFTQVLAVSEPPSDAASPVYRFSITSLAQVWVRSTVAQRILIGGYTEASSLDRFVFYGSAAPDDLRPRLKITYSPVR